MDKHKDNTGDKHGAGSVESDARGQFVRSRHGAKNDGTVSADPRVLSGDETGDATFPIGNHRESGSRKPVEKTEPSHRPQSDSHESVKSSPENAERQSDE